MGPKTSENECFTPKCFVFSNQQYTVKILIESHGALFFNPLKIQKIEKNKVAILFFPLAWGSIRIFTV